MKKSNQKGFIMAETIVVSVIVLIALVIIYTQFITINNSYQKSFKYNNIDDLYKLNNVRNFLLNNIDENVIEIVNEANYIDISLCQDTYFIEYTYCKTLFEELEIEKIYITKENVSEISNNLFDEGMNNFIKTINSTGNEYRIIAKFKNSYATLKFNIGG